MEGRMYVPVMNGLLKKYRDEYQNQFRKIGNVNPVVCIERTFDPMRNEVNFEILKENLDFLRKEGYTPFVWAQAFGFGIPLDEREKALSKNFERITDFDGAVLQDAMCPLGEEFLAYYKRLIQGIAKAGARRIMLDDDLCLSVRPGLGCSCTKHLALLCESTGKNVDRETLKKALFKGEGNELRSAWLNLMGDTLIDFCKKVRGFADEIDPEIEMGFCAGYTSWDVEGVDALTLTKVLAGKNKPFMRLTGAPYWVEQRRFDGQGMAQIVEFTRMQRAWCENDGVEIFTENDSYPRPRYRVPAAILETFDFCMAADSGIGQLKYLFEYYSSPAYETGYVSAHLKNRKKRNRVQEIMGNMPSKGIYVHEKMRKVGDMDFGEQAADAHRVMMTAFSNAADLLSSCAVPTTYEAHDGVAIAFGDSGRTIDYQSQKGVIIDFAAAKALMKRGVDVGIASYQKAEIPFTEKYLAFSDQVLLDGCVRRHAGANAFYACELSQNAKVESVFPMTDREIPASYRYENADGIKFLVFLFDASFLKPNSGLSCAYYRQRQILDAAEWMGDRPIASIENQPGMYMIVKADQEKTAIAFSNFSLDAAEDVLIKTNVNGARLEAIGVEAEKEENGIRVKCVQPWQTGCVILYRK